MSKGDIEFGHAKVEDFFYWINERHSIYLKKAAGEPRPWTEDEILDTFKFTNAFRQLDHGTVWVTENIIWTFENRAQFAKGYGGSLQEMGKEMSILLFNIVSFRMYNYWKAQEKLGYVTDWDEDRKDWMALTGKIFTSAHMTVGEAGKTKKETYLAVFDELWPLREKLCKFLMEAPTMEEAFRRLLQFKVYGIGKFIAYEIISDLRWTAIGDHWTDRLTWANIGPGCKRGLQRLGMEATVESLQKLYGMAPQFLSDDTRYHHVGHCDAHGDNHPHNPPFEMREIEHSLCEFDKYQRVKTGVGRPREKYRENSRD
ncbi:MAG: hypothetical protein COA69_09585 [Robiginitomaculum sp.]|nr:MAG: hypothetical protein COA69_09585 [Robiginitomaculum sp.]